MASRAAQEKAANLLAYHERKKEEDAAWVEYRQKIQVERETHCPACPLSLLCLAAHCPEDVMICTNCARVFSVAMGLVIQCDGFNDNMGLERPWHSGMCQECYAYPYEEDRRHHAVIEGFSVETPMVAAVKRIQQHHYGGCPDACREES